MLPCQAGACMEEPCIHNRNKNRGICSGVHLANTWLREFSILVIMLDRTETGDVIKMCKSESDSC